METANISAERQMNTDDQVVSGDQHLPPPPPQQQQQSATHLTMSPNYNHNANGDTLIPNYPPTAPVGNTSFSPIGGDVKTPPFDSSQGLPATSALDNSLMVQPNASAPNAMTTTESSNLSINQQQQLQSPPPPLSQSIKPLLAVDEETANNPIRPSEHVPQHQQQLPTQSHSSPQKAVITKVKLSDELNIFNWLKTTDIISQIAEKAKSSVDSVITTLDPGMKEYLYSGGDINIMVISDSSSLVSSIRDAFQCVFGRATVVAAKYQPPVNTAMGQYPIKLARGFNESIKLAKEIIRRLRLDTNNVPQNQVVVAIQPTLVQVGQQQSTSMTSNNHDDLNEMATNQQWFLTYCMLIEDPVLNASMNSFSQLVPIDNDTVDLAQETVKQFPDNFPDKHLGFPKSIDELMTTKLNLRSSEHDEDSDEGSAWIRKWATLEETEVVHHLALILANLYRRKWSECVS